MSLTPWLFFSLSLSFSWLFVSLVGSSYSLLSLSSPIVSHCRQGGVVVVCLSLGCSFWLFVSLVVSLYMSLCVALSSWLLSSHCLTLSVSHYLPYSDSELPRPDVELQRAQLSKALSVTFAERCKNVLQIEPPAVALVRWTNVQLTLPYAGEPLWR